MSVPPEPSQDHSEELQRLREYVELLEADNARLQLAVAEYRDSTEAVRIVMWKLIDEGQPVVLDGVTHVQHVLEHADGSRHVWNHTYRGDGVGTVGVTTWTLCP